MCHRTRGDVADAAFEARVPIFLGRGCGMDRVDPVFDIAPSFTRALAQHDLVGDRALAPVDVARVVAFTHRSHADDLVALPAADRAVTAQALAGEVGRQAHRIDRRVD